MNTHLDLVLMWHMHQPDYRNYDTGIFTMPWVYLHAIKDYTDMADHLERHPNVKAVVNFVPILLDQIEEYAEQFTFGDVRDPLLRTLVAPDMDRIDPHQRDLIFRSCFKSNHSRMIEPFANYRRMHELYRMLESQGEAGLNYLSGQYLGDLIVWYHLAWTGESVRRSNETVARLMAQGDKFTHADRFELYNIIGESIRGIIPRYRKLAESGQVELSTTPHFHPLAPLLLDFKSARESMPNISLPHAAYYPGGRGRVAYHVRSARESHHRRFGMEPQGMWPAEGAVSDAFLEIVYDHKCHWVASGEAVLMNSLRKTAPEHSLPERGRCLYRPYRVNGQTSGLTCFFRDDRLSDLIGFEYAKWHGRDAAMHLIQELEGIARGAGGGEVPVVSIMLDGENAWEYYPYNGYYFLDDLYSILESHPFIRTTTFSENIASSQTPVELSSLVAGSWVYGTFSTWVGDVEKNHAWELLCEAKQNFDRVMNSGRLSEKEQAAAERQLASCESSDWFWWFGDYNPTDTVEAFDRLFRDNLANLYRLLKLPVPAGMCLPISRGGGHPAAGGTMRRSA